MRATFSPDGIRDKTPRMSSSQNHTLRAGLYMVLCTACFVSADSFIKIIGNTLPVGQIMAILGFLSCIFLLAICAQQGILRHTPMIFSRAVLLRSILDLAAGLMFISALMNMPIANMAAIMQSVPLVVVLVAIIFLGEKGGVKRIAAVTAGFLGVMLVIKPAPQSLSIYQLLALGTVVVVALRDVVTRKIPPHVPLLIVALANAVFAGIGGLGFGLVQGIRAMESWQIFVLLAASIFTTLGYIFIVATVRLGELSATAPFRYAEVLFAIIAGVLVFHEFPDLLAYAGMALIIAAGLYAARLESARSHDAKVELMPPVL
jgi:S-adenosylmethionine uptake transporter